LGTGDAGVYGRASVLLWDEPLNYIDVLAREQIEQSVREWRPTLVFVEHDRRFIQRIATRVIEMY
jgi:lincosamide and streptogramin A transport system ATP-binding/permease protein